MTPMTKQEGLVAATYTPMYGDGTLCLEAIPAMVDHLERQGVAGLFACGSTGEGMNLAMDERREVAAAYVAAARGRIRAFVHVGHNCLDEACELAVHAEEIGADAVSALAPNYYPLTDNQALVDSVARIAAAAPNLPFYYYHIPALTGINTDILDFLDRAVDCIPNLAGVKFTSYSADVYLTCRERFGEAIDMVWGYDEMLLPGLAMGARGAIGSTFNFATPLYLALMRSFDEGRIAEARELQALAIRMIRAFYTLPFHPAVKGLLSRLGVPCGPCRLPLPQVSEQDLDRIWKELEVMNVTRWFTADPAEVVPMA